MIVVLMGAVLGVMLAGCGFTGRVPSERSGQGDVIVTAPQMSPDRNGLAVGLDGRPSSELALAEHQKDSAAFALPQRLLDGEDEGALASVSIDVQSYELRGSFDWQTRLMTATVGIELMIRSDAGDVLVLDSEVKEVRAVFLAWSNSKIALPFVVDRNKGTLSIAKWDLPPAAQKAGSALRLDIDYVAAANTARPEHAGSQLRSTLHAVAERADDPVAARVFYTTAEPLGAATWMPCHNVPSDRAVFKSTFTMPQQERLIANGRLASDRIDAATEQRSMSYQTDYDLPTYLMAFAVGEFQVTEVQHGSLPVSLWARKGLRFDSTSMIQAVVTMIEQMEERLIKYPFEKYAVVLLPQFPAGGIEHASISFQTENRTTDAAMRADYSLTAHELAHQWFGDYVTVATWDDLWVKEGMATMLGAEAMHAFEDKNRTGVLPGAGFGFVQGEAMRDRALPPGAKYTSGPYGRAAWAFNQVRSAVGETVFWNTMRSLLVTHAFGTMSSDDVVKAFEPHLTSEQHATFVGAIDNRDVPKLVARDAGFVLEDPGSSLIVPIEIHLLNPKAGTRDVRQLVAGGSLTNESLQDAGHLPLFDPKGVHANLESFGQSTLLGDTSSLTLGQLEAVAQAGPLALFRTLGQILQVDTEGAAADTSQWATWSKRFVDLFKDSGSDSASLRLVEKLCAAADVQPQGAKLTMAQLGEGLVESLTYRGQVMTLAADGRALQGCQSDAWSHALSRELALAAARRTESPQRLALLRYLVGSAGERVHSWEAVATGAENLRLRSFALLALNDGLAADIAQGQAKQGSDRAQVWTRVLNDVLGASTVSDNIAAVVTLARTYQKMPAVEPQPVESVGHDLLPGWRALFAKHLPARAAEKTFCDIKPLLGDEAWLKLLQDVTPGPNGPVAERLATAPELCSA